MLAGRYLTTEIGPLEQGRVENTIHSATTITGDSGTGTATITMRNGGKRLEARGDESGRRLTSTEKPLCAPPRPFTGRGSRIDEAAGRAAWRAAWKKT